MFSKEPVDWEEWGSSLGILPPMKKVNLKEEAQKGKSVEDMLLGKFGGAQKETITKKQGKRVRIMKGDGQ